ncbi:ORF3 [Tacheng Tick Virus 7]|uniref:ORF3 n=1 Tax=Tacheng Tick Virus 7 TaxID=1608089 RepID=A0A0B5KK58_9RHAB|nr:ORF3 [Tacheng Tick Virus 7]AJG39145.1 ORF3 [Tacheng Tick Virus 7]
MSKHPKCNPTLYLSIEGKVEVHTLVRPVLDKIVGRLLITSGCPSSGDLKHHVRAAIAGIIHMLTFDPVRGRHLLMTDGGPRMGRQLIWNMSASLIYKMTRDPRVAQLPTFEWSPHGTFSSEDGTVTKWQVHVKTSTAPPSLAALNIPPGRITDQEYMRARSLVARFHPPEGSREPTSPRGDTSGSSQGEEEEHLYEEPMDFLTDLGGLKQRR